MIELGNNIKEYILKHFGGDFLVRYADYIYKPHINYIRLHPDKTKHERIISGLGNYGITLEKLDNFENAYAVKSGNESLGKTLEYTLGLYYIQSLSSMIPPLVVKPTSEDKVLDLCAAPGSKTTQLAEMMDYKGQIYANELVINRIKILVHNMEKQSIPNIGIIKGKGEVLSNRFPEYFDKILVDAPCSALGILQKKGEVSNWWNKDLAQNLSDTQFKLLVSAIKMAKVGGEITYSTCTLTLEENELVLHNILKKYPVELEEIELPVPSQPAFTKYEGEQLNPSIKLAHRIIPWEINSEGFFVAKLRKTDEVKGTAKVKKTKNNFFVSAGSSKIKEKLQKLSDQFDIPYEEFAQYKYYFKKNDVFFIHKDWETDTPDMFVRIGLKFGQFDRHNNIQLKNYPAKVFEHMAKRNVTELNNWDDIKTYFDGRIIKHEFEAKGKQIIKIRGDVAGVAVASKDGLKSQFPRALRTSEILLPDKLS